MKKKKGFELRRVGTEEILVATGVEHIDFGHIISMNPSAAWLWTRAGEEAFGENELAAWLQERYEVDESTACADARRLLDQWLEAGIIE